MQSARSEHQRKGPRNPRQLEEELLERLKARKKKLVAKATSGQPDNTSDVNLNEV
jgi:hypothetical protein